MNPHLDRALLLFQQGRHELAEQELRQVIAADPNLAYARSLLAMCLAERKQFGPATEEAQQAIAIAPDEPFGHYALAHVLVDRNRHDEALSAVREAIRLDPYNADYCALEAQCLHNLNQWTECLAAAERGLEIDAEHVACTNLRAIALVKLGRKSEAGAAIDAALAKQPESAVTHANMGWTLLHQSEPRKALEHFREALRLQPGNEWAQAGIVEALKARNVIYALMLKYFLFMSRLSSGAQWGIILGSYFLGRVLAGMANQDPEIAPWILPVRILLFSFVILTWMAYPLFNLLLRLNRFGRLVLQPEQIKESNWIGLFLGLALVSLAGMLVGGINSPWFMALTVFGLFLMPLAGLFRCRGNFRWIMLAAISVLLLVGLAALVQNLRAYQGDDRWIKSLAEQSFGLLGLYGMGILVTTLMANFLGGREEKS